MNARHGSGGWYLSLLTSLVLGLGGVAYGTDGFALVPVSATGGYAIDGSNINLISGDQTVFFEVWIGGWDPNHDGNPLLRGYQFQLDAAGFTSGTTGTLSIADVAIPCSTGADCPNYNAACHGTVCADNGAFFADQRRPDFIFYGIDTISAVNFSEASPFLGSVIVESGAGVPDLGMARYAATIGLNVPADASGTFTLELVADETKTLWFDSNSFVLDPPTLTPATITIGSPCGGNDQGTPDCNGNGIVDVCDILGGTSVDCNANAIPDECELSDADCNANGVPDDCDLAGGTSADCNGNGAPDECDIGNGTSGDCNGNGVPDECEADCNANGVPDDCDLSDGTSADCNGNGVPDECEADCNTNGVPDDCDLNDGTSHDCNGNGLPDECEWADCNGNGVLDVCDLASGVLWDDNGDGVPDTCEPFQGFEIVPVGATGQHVIRGRTIILGLGDQQVTFEIRVGGWDPDHNGSPRLRTLQAQVDATGFTSGSAGSLSLASVDVPCSVNADCPAYGAHCTDGICDFNGGFFVDMTHPSYVFSGLESLGVVSMTDPSPVAGAVLLNDTDAVADDGTPKYLATMVLDVSADADGTFTVGLELDQNYTLMVDEIGAIIPITDYLPATVEIGAPCDGNPPGEPDCNGNGVVDLCDVLGGDSIDCNANFIPDECEADCNGNGTADECDIADGTSVDCGGNGVPDECEIGSTGDCNDNGVPDDCDVANGTSADCNDNHVPDECDVADGDSADCNDNGVPDECEGNDCNGNGRLDVCDLAVGLLNDDDGNGIPDECEPLQGFAIVPTGATGTYVIRNRTIYLAHGGEQVAFELRVGGWDPGQHGWPRLRALQGQIDPTGFTSGSAGSLSLASIPIPCAVDADCPMSYTQCVDGTCEVDGAFYIDESHPGYVFSGLSDLAAANTVQPNPLIGATTVNVDDAVVDDGASHYFGTMVLDVSEDAEGTFDVAFTNDLSANFMLAGDGSLIAIQALLPAVVKVGVPCDVALPGEPDCNGNGVVDLCDLLDGSSTDANGNGVPDACDLMPSVVADGSRFLRMAMSGAVDESAKIVVQCAGGMERFAKSPSGTMPNVAQLTENAAQAAWLTPAEWKSPLYVTGLAVAPNRDYLVSIETADGTRSAPVRVSTGRWGDITGPDGPDHPDGRTDFRDISAVVSCFLAQPDAPTMAQCDLEPAEPNNVVDFKDISAIVDAFLTGEYPYDTVVDCPSK